MFGNEDDWHEDEKNRMIGDVDAFGKIIIKSYHPFCLNILGVINNCIH